jgi:hypothetical protein
VNLGLSRSVRRKPDPATPCCVRAGRKTGRNSLRSQYSGSVVLVEKRSKFRTSESTTRTALRPFDILRSMAFCALCRRQRNR